METFDTASVRLGRSTSRWRRVKEARYDDPVLVVDDETHVEVLFSGHYAMDFALSDEAALDKLAGRVGGISLLVSDISMPAVNGLDLLPAVKERRPDLPVFMIPAYDDADTIVPAMGRGAEQFHAMPMDFPKLNQGIMAAMGDARGNG